MKKWYETNADIYIFVMDKMNTSQPQFIKSDCTPV